MEKTLASGLRAGKFLATLTHFTTRESALEKVLMSVANADMDLFSTNKFTLEKGLTGVVDVENSLAAKPTSFDTGQCTLEQGLMSAVNVGNPLLRALAFFDTGELTCRECRKFFSCKHQKVHTGERPCVCRECAFLLV